MTNDMTVGKPIKVITTFAIPLFIGNIFQQVYNVVDSIVVGRYVGAQALAAVGACTGCYILLLALITGLTNGMAVVTAQYFGAKNYEMVKKTFVSSMIVILVTGLIITIVGVGAADLLLRALGTPEDVMPDAKTYLVILSIGTLANCLYNVVSSVLRALGDSLIPLIILIATSIMNVVLDLVFVIVCHMGVAGVALATVLSQLISAIICMGYMIKKMPILRFNFTDCRLESKIVREIVRIGFPAALSSCGISISVMFMQRAVNAYGSITAAGYTIGGRAEQIGMCLAFAIGLAVGTFCGQNAGARKMDRVAAGMRAGYMLAIVYATIVAIILFAFAPVLARIFNDDPEVIKVAISYIRIVAVFAPVLGLLFIYQNFLRSVGDVSPTVWMSVTEIVARSVLAFTFSWLFGYVGIWWATPVGWTASLIIGFVRYRSGHWKKKMLEV